ALSHEGVELFEILYADDGVKLAHLPVHTRPTGVVVRLDPIVAHFLNPRDHIRVAAGNESTFNGHDDFCDGKREHLGVSESSNLAAVALRAESMSGVVNHAEPSTELLRGCSHDAFDFCGPSGQTIHMDRNDSEDILMLLQQRF